ncbi:MAG: Glucose-phosphate thymidylyltransferase [Francisellaceae bacterium]|nr:Glucose-phosphate thymidylyltransferase [Francisellaceae bacterium]
MKGIILAGGKGTRLAPLTEVTNKHLLPVGREPMIWHSIRQLVTAGITDILLVTSTEHMGDIVNSLGSGYKFGCNLTYKVQEKPNGIAGALLLAQSFALNEKIVVILGDNIFEYTISDHVNQFNLQEKGSYVLLKEVKDPERYGIAALDEKQIISIVEKPSYPISNYAVVGCYLYDTEIFEIINSLKLSPRGEFEITDVNNHYAKLGQLKYGFVKGRWTDAGTFESLAQANRLLLDSSNLIKLDK